METCFSGFAQGSFDKKFLDKQKLVVNSNAGKITSDGKGKGFNTIDTSGFTDSGTVNIMNVYDTCGNNVTYTDALNNTYYLCFTYTVTATKPIPINPLNTRKYVVFNNCITVTLGGQYFGLGKPPPGPGNDNLYPLWTTLADNKHIPIGNPQFNFNSGHPVTSQASGASLFLNALNNNGTYISVPTSKPQTSLSHHYIIENGVVKYNITSQLEFGYGDLSTTNTNIFTNSNNKSQTFKNLSSTTADTTFFSDYHINSSTPNTSAGFLIFSVNII